MSLNGSGTYSLPAGQPVVTGTTISSTTFNTLTSDLATALSTAVYKDGQQTVTANIPLGGFKITGLGAAASNGDAVRYEQVTNTTAWTPVLTFATAGDLAVSYSTQVGRYTRVGNLVVLEFNIQTSAFTHTTASGALQITGLPTAAITLTGYNALGAMSLGGVTKANYTNFSAQVQSGASLIAVAASGSGQSPTQLAAGDLPTGGSVILQGSIAYRVA